jgi:hypothetical protein
MKWNKLNGNKRYSVGGGWVSGGGMHDELGLRSRILETQIFNLFVAKYSSEDIIINIYQFNIV